MRDFRPQSDKSRFDRVLQAFAQTRPGGWLFINVLPAIDRPLLKLSRGRLSTGTGQTYVLLHARGARSGVERTTPLLGTKSGDAVLLVASKAGAPSTRRGSTTCGRTRTSASRSTASGTPCGPASLRARSASGYGPSCATTTRATPPTRRGPVGA